MSEPVDPPARRRRRYRLAAAVGAVAAVGAGTLVAHDLLADRTTTVTEAGQNAVGAPPSIMDPLEPAPSVPLTPSPTAHGTAGAAPSPAAVQFPPPPTASPIRALEAPEDVPAKVVSYRPADGQTLRIVTARGDLTGQRELTWAGDNGHAVGAARCTRTFKLSPDQPASTRETMVLCWRTSARRSVYVIAIDIHGRPSERTTAAIVNREWKKLG